MSLVPGGSATVRAALRRRLRAWHAAVPDRTWLDAEHDFGIPHTHVLRYVRAPRADEHLRADPGDPGFLDLVMSGHGCGDDRAAACARAYAMGATLQEIGDRFGVTRERIRQVLARDTPWSSTELAVAARRLREDRRAENGRAVEEWSISHPGATIDSALGALALSEAQVIEFLGRRRSRHRAQTPRTTPSDRRSDEDILEDLRHFHQETGSMTGAGFSSWARDHGVTGSQTAAIRFGTWNDALRAAGIAQVSGNTRSSFTDDDLWAAVVAFVKAPDGGTTARAAAEWFGAHPSAPSAALIRHRIDATWSEIVTRALAAANGDEALDPDWVSRVCAERDWNEAVAPIDPVQHVRDAIVDLGPRITTAAYGRWARENRRPGVPTLQSRAGKVWTELLADAGGIPNRAKARGRSADDCARAVREFLDVDPSGGSQAYAKWASAHGEPSLSTLADRWGSWNEARAAAQG